MEITVDLIKSMSDIELMKMIMGDMLRDIEDDMDRGRYLAKKDYGLYYYITGLCGMRDKGISNEYIRMAKDSLNVIKNYSIKADYETPDWILDELLKRYPETPFKKGEVRYRVCL